MTLFFSKKKKEAEAERRRESSGSDKDSRDKSHGSPSRADGKAARARGRPSISSSSGTDDEPHKAEREDTGEPHHGSSHSMPPISNGSSNSRLGLLRASSEDGTAANTGSNPMLAAAAVRRPSHGKPLLPRLTSAHSLPTGKVSSAASLTPTISSAPSGSTKRSSGHGSADLVPMPRHTPSDAAPASLQSPPQHQQQKRLLTDTRRTSNSSSAVDASKPLASPVLARPLRIATEVTTPDAKRTKTAAELHASSSTSTTASTAGSNASKPAAPVFSAMESVAKRPGSSFRLQKRRKSAQDSTGASSNAGGSGGAASSRNATTNNSSISLNSGSVSASTTGAGAPPPADNAFDASRKERQANGVGSSHGRRREPKTSFTAAPESEAQRPVASVYSGSFHVPLPPPMSTESLEPTAVNKSPKRRGHHHHRSSSASQHSTTGEADDKDSAEPTPSIRKSRRSSMRMQTPRSAGPLHNTSLSSSDDLPRPLTRHASTLSSGQREALKRTPSFLSRSHTPPPCDLRESVQLRRVRKPSLSEGLPGDTPQPTSSSSGRTNNKSNNNSASNKNDNTSFSSESTMLFSGLFPPPPPPAEERRITSASKRVGAHSASERDAVSGTSSASASLMSSQMRPASRAPRSLAAASPDTSIPAPPPGATAACSSDSSTTTAYIAVPVARPPSARSAQQRLRQDILSNKVDPPPLSRSPEPVMGGKRTDTAGRPQSRSTTPQSLTAMNSGGATAAAAVPAAPTASTASVFSSEAELFDYYGSFMLTAPNFDRSAGQPNASSPPDGSAAAAGTSATATKPAAPKRGADVAAAAVAAAARLTRTPSSESKRMGMGSASFTSEPASLGDVLPESSSPPQLESGRAPTTTTTTATPTTTSSTAKPKKDVPKPTSATTPTSNGNGASTGSLHSNGSGNGPLSDSTRAMRPAGRHRQVNTYIDDDDDDNGIFQVAGKTGMGGAGGGKSGGTSSSAKTETTTTTSSGYDYMLDSGSSMKYMAAAAAAGGGRGESRSSSSSLASPATTSPSPVPARRLIAHSLPSSVAVSVASAMSKLSSSDDDDDDEDEEEEDEEGLLEGFRPALFDAARNKRRGSSIIFYLDRKDSLSSTDVVVKPGGDGGRGSAAVLFSPVQNSKAAPSPPPQQTQSDYSLLKVGTYSPNSASMGGAAAPGESVARPRVTMEPYVPLGSSVIGRTPVPPAPSSSSANKSLSLIADPYGLLMDSSSTSVQASVPRLSNHRASLTRTAPEKAAAADPVSIFLGTTSRFAPDPAKMHRPLANTFGYSAAQRRARAAALASGVTAEAWATAAGLDDDEDGDGEEGDGYAEVYTDENGDEWYWEEVEEGEEGEYGDDEAEETEEEGVEEEERKPAVHRVNVSLPTNA